MFSSEINNILENNAKTRKIFKGTFSCDKVPLHLGSNYLIIVNTDSSLSSGEHWVLFYQPNFYNIVWFDSLANKFTDYSLCFIGLFKKLTKNKQIIQIKYTLQSDSSNLCGAYCIYFAIQLATGKDINTIISKKFSRNKLENDKLICYWFKKVFPSHNCYKSGQNCTCMKIWKK